MAGSEKSCEKRKFRILRAPNFPKIWEQGMDWITENMWAPLVPLAFWLWRMIHRHDKELAVVKEAISDSSGGRKAIYDKIESVRLELASQHATLRKEQREDFKEIRDLIVNGGK
jgi:hypothetical protein